MPVQKLREFLDSEHVAYATIPHAQAFTAQEVAASTHIPGKEMAKTVMVKLDGKMAMAVVPADHKVDLKLLKEASGARKVELASEEDFMGSFPNCEVGAMPPFGNLYGMDVFIEESLGDNEKIAFNAGTHTEIIELDYRDFERLARPKVFAAHQTLRGSR